MEQKIRVMIVNDYPAVRADLRTMLELMDNIEVVSEASSGSLALQLAQSIHPDLILLDLDRDQRQTERIDDSNFLQQIKDNSPRSTIFVFSVVGCDTQPIKLPTGLDAYFIKGADTDHLFDQIRNFRNQEERNIEMQQTSNLQVRAVEQVKPAAAIQAMVGTRLAYIDILRTILIILVILVHAAVTYGAIGSWTYEDPVQDEIAAISLSFFVIACQSFFMGLYFFFAGFFTPGAYDRKGLGRFWKERLLRLGIPMVLYTWFLSKIPNYLDAVANQGMTLSFGQFFVRTFWSDADEGPTWFLFALLIFSAGYTLWRLATRNAGLKQRLSKVPVPSTRVLLLASLLMAILTFAVSQVWPLGKMTDIFEIFSLQLQFFPTYIILFTAGAVAYRSNWLANLPDKSLRFWTWCSAVLLITLPTLFFLGGATDGYLDAFMGGLNWRCVSFSLWLGLACIAFSMTLTLWVRKRVGSNSRLAAFTGPNNFAVYLIHPLILVPITISLSYLAIPSLAKFGLASVPSVILCFSIAEVLRRIPGVKEIL
ncbi:MAG: hypothetical protein CVU39_07095 [Chloroflexi bacterium HGW-Chloroflexi-10]|nr:MAG: hypothetical protein CVU39_07095 [Chloroflexi bacterium HGW-Chloroflexi-10]